MGLGTGGDGGGLGPGVGSETGFSVGLEVGQSQAIVGDMVGKNPPLN